CVDDATTSSFDPLHELGSGGGDPRKVTEEIEGCSLGGEKTPGRASQLYEGSARLDVAPVSHRLLPLDARVDHLEYPFGHRHPCDRAIRPAADHCPGGDVGGQNCLGGDVAVVSEILFECPGHQLVHHQGCHTST